MIDKDIIIITKKNLFDLIKDVYYIGESGQYSYIDDELIEKKLNEKLEEE